MTLASPTGPEAHRLGEVSWSVKNRRLVADGMDVEAELAAVGLGAQRSPEMIIATEGTGAIRALRIKDGTDVSASVVQALRLAQAPRTVRPKVRDPLAIWFSTMITGNRNAYIGPHPHHGVWFLALCGSTGLLPWAWARAVTGLWGPLGLWAALTCMVWVMTIGGWAWSSLPRVIAEGSPLVSSWPRSTGIVIWRARPYPLIWAMEDSEMNALNRLGRITLVVGKNA